MLCAVSGGDEGPRTYHANVSWNGCQKVETTPYQFGIKSRPGNTARLIPFSPAVSACEALCPLLWGGWGKTGLPEPRTIVGRFYAPYSEDELVGEVDLREK